MAQYLKFFRDLFKMYYVKSNERPSKMKLYARKAPIEINSA